MRYHAVSRGITFEEHPLELTWPLAPFVFVSESRKGRSVVSGRTQRPAGQGILSRTRNRNRELNVSPRLQGGQKREVETVV